MRLHALLFLTVALIGCAFASEPAADAPKPALTAAQMEPRAASVVFVGGMKVEKCWYEERATGAWINYDGQRFWYTKDSIQTVTFLTGEPDADLKEWLRKSEDARKKEEERTAKADEERQKKEKEDGTPPIPPVASSGSSSAVANPSAPGAQKDERKNKPNANSNSGTGSVANQGNGNSGGNNDNGNGNRRVGAGYGYGGVVGRGGVGVGGTGVGIGGAGNFVNGNLGAQWRVKDVNRKEGTVYLKNRLFQQFVTLKVKEPDDLKHVKVGQILEGMLSMQQPTLTAPDGTAVEFEISGLQPNVAK